MPQRLTPEMIPEPAVEICRQLRDAGERAWIVGGCVRDLLRGEQVNDWDIATSAKPEKVKKTFRRVIPTGEKHGTVTVLWKDEAYEVTTLRGDGDYSDGRRPDSVTFVSDIEEDLARRDFTVNAIAYDPIDDVVVDPFGGVEDMKRGLLRAVGDPAARFAEDGLRILRGARFVATLEYELEDNTEIAFSGALDTFAKVSRERVREEWLKAMKARTPSRAFEVMRRTGILDVTFPELVTMHGCEQNRWHAYDVWDHTMHVLDASEPEPVLRMAALLHDVAKPRTRAHSEKTNDWTFYHHEKVGADMADRWLHDYRFSNSERQDIVHLVRHHLVCYASDWSDAAVRRFVKRVGQAHIDPLLALARADALGKGRPVDDQLALLEELRGRADAVIEEGSALGVGDLRISGRDIIPLLGGPGPRVGVILRQLLDEVIDDPKLNEEATLLARAKVLAQEVQA